MSIPTVKGNATLEVKPLGLKVTIVEPGGFRTDFAGASMAFAKPIEAYAPTVGAMRGYMEAHDGGPGVLRECLLDPDVRVVKTVVVNCALELAPHDAELRDLVYYFSSDLLMVFYTCPSPFRLAKIYRATHSVFGSAGRLPAAYFFPGNL